MSKLCINSLMVHYPFVVDQYYKEILYYKPLHEASIKTSLLIQPENQHSANCQYACIAMMHLEALNKSSHANCLKPTSKCVYPCFRAHGFNSYFCIIYNYTPIITGSSKQTCKHLIKLSLLHINIWLM